MGKNKHFALAKTQAAQELLSRGANEVPVWVVQSFQNPGNLIRDLGTFTPMAIIESIEVQGF